MDTGLHFIVGLSGPSLLEEEAQLLTELNPAGVILFKYNFSNTPDWLENLSKLISDIRAAINRPNVIISIDHEGGKVHRLQAPINHFPDAIHWKDSAKQVGVSFGKELSSLGINLNFAPVLDIHQEPDNPIIGNRALACEHSSVVTYGREFIQGMESQGVMACGKHFPGHGNTKTDSHKELPVVQADRDSLLACEVMPFKELANNLKMLMTAHVLYPALDKDNPATTSSTILTDLLRDQIGFEGVVITDALEMKALDGSSYSEKGIQSLEAGADILLIAQPEEESALKIATKMAKDIQVKGIDSKESQSRIEQFLKSIKNHPVCNNNQELENLCKKGVELVSLIGEKTV